MISDRYESVLNKDESSRLDVTVARALDERANGARGGGPGGGGPHSNGEREINDLALSLRKLFAARVDDEVHLTHLESQGGGSKMGFRNVSRCQYNLRTHTWHVCVL
jgi:hypothetical protein